MKLVLGLLPLALAVPAHAQFAVYGTFDYTHLSDPGENSNSNLVGGGVGIYDDTFHLLPIHLGGDVRFNIDSGNNLRYRSILAGPRIALKVPVLPLRPYVEGLIGGGGTEPTGTLAAGISGRSYNTKFTYGFVGGLDWTLLPHVDFRALEIGYQHQSGYSGEGGIGLVSVRTGLALRF